MWHITKQKQNNKEGASHPHRKVNVKGLARLTNLPAGITAWFLFRMNILIVIEDKLHRLLVWEWGQDWVPLRPIFFIPACKDVEGTKNRYTWDVFDEGAQLDSFTAELMHAIQSFPVIPGYLSSMGAYLERCHCDLEMRNICDKMLIFLQF